MNSLLRKTGLLLLLALPLSLAAQEYPESGIFRDSAQELSVLYRGRLATKYNVLANGNPYWISSAFLPGTIKYEGRLYSDVELNIDVLTHEPLVKIKGSSITVALNQSNVEWFTAGDTRFVNLRLRGREDMEEGFYEVLHEGSFSMYKRVDKRLNFSVNPVNGGGIGYEDPNYNSNYHSYFEYIPRFYFCNEEGEMQKIRGKGAVIRQFPKKARKSLRRYASDKGLDGINVSYDDYCRALLDYAESL